MDIWLLTVCLDGYKQAAPQQTSTTPAHLQVVQVVILYNLLKHVSVIEGQEMVQFRPLNEVRQTAAAL